jgi:hypothetical protein
MWLVWFADHLKLMFPMCWAVTEIAWAMIDGEQLLRRDIFEGKSNWDWAERTLRFGVEYLLACHIKDDAFVVQARHRVLLCTNSRSRSQLGSATSTCCQLLHSIKHEVVHRAPGKV